MKLLKDNRPMPGIKPKPGDFAVIFIVVLLAAAISLFYYNSFSDPGKKYAAIYQNGRLVKRVPLDGLKDRIDLEITGAYINIVSLENEKACISYSTCREQVCVHTGWVSRPGQSSVCLPNQVVVQIVGDNADFDGISR